MNKKLNKLTRRIPIKMINIKFILLIKKFNKLVCSELGDCKNWPKNKL